MTLSRRDFLAGTPAALAGFGLMQAAPTLFAQAAPVRAQAPVSSRTVVLVG